MSIAKLQVGVLVFCSFAFELPRHFESAIKEINCHGNNYVYKVTTTLGENEIYQILYRTILPPLLKRYIPLVINMVLTFRLVRFLIHKKKLRHKLVLPEIHTSVKAKYTTVEPVTMVLTVIAASYIICLIPSAFYPFFPLFTETESCDSLYNYFSVLADTLAILNSALNFFIYYLNIPVFRKCLKNMIKIRYLDKDKVTTVYPAGQSKTSDVNIVSSSI